MNREKLNTGRRPLQPGACDGGTHMLTVRALAHSPESLAGTDIHRTITQLVVSSIPVIDAPTTLRLSDHIGERVSVTGVLVEREIQVPFAPQTRGVLQLSLPHACAVTLAKGMHSITVPSTPYQISRNCREKSPQGAFTAGSAQVRVGLCGRV